MKDCPHLLCNTACTSLRWSIELSPLALAFRLKGTEMGSSLAQGLEEHVWSLHFSCLVECFGTKEERVVKHKEARVPV